MFFFSFCFFWLIFALLCQSFGSEFNFAKPVCIFPCGFLLVWLSFDLVYVLLALVSFVFPVIIYTHYALPQSEPLGAFAMF